MKSKDFSELAVEAASAGNTKKALEYINLGMEQNNLDCIALKGQYYEKQEHNHTKALQYYLQAADQWNETGIVSAGMLMVNEKSGVYDLKRGLGYLEIGASRGITEALETLALVYLEGKPGLEKDYEKGIVYILEAKKNGSKLADDFIASIEKLSSEHNKDEI